MGRVSNAEQWRELIRQFDEGDLSLSALCQAHGVPDHRFHYWCSKFATAPACGKQLVPVVLNPAGKPVIHQSTPTLRARLPNGVEIVSPEATQLAELLPALASL